MQIIPPILERARGWKSRPLPQDRKRSRYGPRHRAIEVGRSVCRPYRFAHYGEQNGDLMRDPEMCFEFRDGGA
jgi:hypothetical protein